MTSESALQYVSDEHGNAVAVLVPIDIWREIESECETAYLLASEPMKKRLLEAKSRIGRISDAESAPRFQSFRRCSRGAASWRALDERNCNRNLAFAAGDGEMGLSGKLRVA